jgi:hypothetical protein
MARGDGHEGRLLGLVIEKTPKVWILVEAGQSLTDP